MDQDQFDKIKALMKIFTAGEATPVIGDLSRYAKCGSCLMACRNGDIAVIKDKFSPRVKLRSILLMRGVTQRQLADRIDIPERYICNWGTGRGNLTSEEKERVADFLGVKVEDFDE